MSRPFCYRFQEPPVGRADRVKAPNGSDCCGDWNCRIVYEIIDKNHNDWLIACRNTEVCRKVREFRDEERRKLKASNAATDGEE